MTRSSFRANDVHGGVPAGTDADGGGGVARSPSRLASGGTASGQAERSRRGGSGGADTTQRSLPLLVAGVSQLSVNRQITIFRP